ncbi:hypothetical protein ED733_006175 [Metarhizium rileyi]|uniref:Kinetochore Mis14 n=1 Tax=Metarhizium rileyi (strain RCEF 4871) TaxID=1649241 RepID=A0A5C6GG97_METRR|nr:hypothetical protein ED733_006175 [Metarhizium rileyi]
MDQESVVSQVQRKIELQSPEDLAFLVAKVRSAAATRISEAFPQVPGQGEEDALRNEIESLVNDYIDQTFAFATPNLSINGLPVSSTEYLSRSPPAAPEAYEPFDARKRQRVADLIAQEERLLEEVAALKRSVPGKAAAEQAAHVGDAIRHDDDTVELRRAAAVAAAGKEPGLHVDKLQRQDGVEAGFRAAVEALGRLKRDMPAVVAKMERASVAGEYVLGAK